MRSKKENRFSPELKKRHASFEKFTGIWIPKPFLFLDELSLTEIYLLMIIKAYNTNGKCFEGSNKQLAVQMGLSEGRISQMVSLLKELKLVYSEEEKFLDPIEGMQTKRKIYITNITRTLYDGNMLIDLTLIDLIKSLIDLSGNLIDYKYIIINKIINNKGIINNTLNDSEESSIDDFSKIDTPIIEKEIHPIIAHWNACQGTRKHQRQNTRVYKTAVKYIKQLQKGVFCSMSTLNQETTQMLSSEERKKKWSEQEIISAIDQMLKIFENGYWPKDKSQIPTDLATLIYNGQTQNSWFLRCWKNPPKLLKEEKKLKISDVNLYNKYKGTIKPTEEQETKFIITINKLHDWYTEVLEDIAPVYALTNFNSYFGTAERFAKQHVKWLEHQGQLHIAYCDPDNSVNFKRFINHIKDEFNFNLMPTKEELKYLRKQFKKEEERFKNRIAGRKRQA